MLSVGGLEIELNHARGETDDHTWAWIPKHKAICAGDFFIWAFPNAGNPQRRSAIPENGRLPCGIWRRAMPSFFLPVTGCRFAARTESAVCSSEVAEVLETMVEQTIDLMNQGAPLTILSTPYP